MKTPVSVLDLAAKVIIHGRDLDRVLASGASRPTLRRFARMLADEGAPWAALEEALEPRKPGRAAPVVDDTRVYRVKRTSCRATICLPILWDGDDVLVEWGPREIRVIPHPPD